MKMFHHSIVILASFLFLIRAAKPVCQSPSELAGLCTSCRPTQILISGYCVVPMPGCQQQLSYNVCGSCMQGYQLSITFCVPLSGTSGASSNYSTYQSLSTYADNAPNYKYQYLDFYLKGKYNLHLRDKLSNISMVFQLKTTYGFVYALTYMNPYSNAGTIYRAEALVDFFNTITQYRFVAVTQAKINDYSQLLWQLERKVKVQHIPALNNAFLNQVQQASSNDFRLFYMSSSGKMYVQDIQRISNASSTNWVFPNLTQLSYQINENTVINYVFSLFPNFQLHATYTINFYSIFSGGSYQDYYKFIFDSQIIVIVLAKGTQLSLHSYEEPDNVISLVQGQGVGGYVPFVNLEDSIYLEVYQFVIQQYPFLSTKQVESVRYQVVSGTNFMIEMNNDPFSKDIYLALVNKPLGNSSPSIISLNKNGVDITQNAFSSSLGVPGAFNYEADHTFKATYDQFKSAVQSEISSLLPIMSVQYVIQANSVIDYMVIFTPFEFAFLRYNPQAAQKYQVVSFTIFGTDIPIIQSNPLNEEASRQDLLDFLQEAKPSLFPSNTILIKYQVDVDISMNGYQIDILTNHGIYFTRIYQKGILYLSKITQVSHSSCSDIDKSQHIANPIINSLNTFILQNYWQVNGFSLSLVQGYISSSGSISYRMLYSSGSSRWEVQIVESMGHYMINKLTSMSGAGCSSSQVKVMGGCKSNCDYFVF